ncbi:MAG: hypothetical protein DWP92_05045 [Armatimonadetes bacterium]|nr:MAG: hypothetical protein DWP92_05045 [Armatimonadota bacterium]
MQRVIQFGTMLFTDGLVLWRRGDPLLMGAAIAYNSLFALVPLGIAFVSVLTLFSGSDALIDNVFEWLSTSLPPQLASFLSDILRQSVDVVSGDRFVILVVSILVALWSGSRAVYAIQKSLRLVQGTIDERGYIRARLTGVVVTVGGGIAIMVAYGAMLIGENAWEEITATLNLPSVGFARGAVVLASLLWVFALLFVIYRFGPPEPLPYAAINAAAVTVVLYLGTIIAGALLPRLSNQAIAVFGSVGVILLWLYFVGVVVVALPLGSLTLLSVLEKTDRQ